MKEKRSNQVVVYIDKVVNFNLYMSMSSLAFNFIISIYDMTARYFFLSPTRWASDTSSYLLCLCVFFALPKVVQGGASIAVTLLVDMAEKRLRRIIQVFIDIVSGLVCVGAGLLFAYLVSVQMKTGIITIGAFAIPKWYLTAVGFYGFFVSGIVYFARAIYGDSLDDDDALAVS